MLCTSVRQGELRQNSQVAPPQLQCRVLPTGTVGHFGGNGTELSILAIVRGD